MKIDTSNLAMALKRAERTIETEIEKIDVKDLVNKLTSLIEESVGKEDWVRSFFRSSNVMGIHYESHTPWATFKLREISRMIDQLDSLDEFYSECKRRLGSEIRVRTHSTHVDLDVFQAVKVDEDDYAENKKVFNSLIIM
jgi:hypothetical protein